MENIVPSDERLNQIFQKTRGEIMDSRITTFDEKLSAIKNEIDILTWYIDMREKFESHDSQMLDEFLDEERANPVLYDDLNRKYGKAAGEENFNFSLEELRMLLDQWKITYEAYKQSVKNNAETVSKEN
ncbi:MAG: hypothetical protein WCO10_03235 [bacterium]